MTKAKDTKADDKAHDAFPEPSKGEILEARAQGVKDAIQESTKEAYKRGADEGYGENSTDSKTQGTKDVFNLQHLVDLDPKELDKRITDGDGVTALSDGQIAGLLEVERSGKNRTDIVQVLCKRLGIKSPYEVTAAGPNFTNDTTRTSL